MKMNNENTDKMPENTVAYRLRVSGMGAWSSR